MNPLVLSAQLTRLSQAKLALHLVSVYVNFVAAVAYFMMWSGFSPILMDTGSCLWVTLQCGECGGVGVPSSQIILWSKGNSLPRMQAHAHSCGDCAAQPWILLG